MASKRKKPRIVIDKSALKACGVADLTTLSRGHRLLLPYGLLYEIWTQEHSDPHEWQGLLLKLKGLDFSVCLYPFRIFQEEMKMCVPATRITSTRDTIGLKNALRTLLPDWPAQEDMVSSQQRSADRAALVVRRKQRLRSLNEPLVQGAFRTVPAVAQEMKCTLARAFWHAMRPVAKEVWREHYRHLPRLATPKSFMFMEVWLANYQDFRRSLDQGADVDGVSDSALFNEALDREYVLLLVRADGLLSKDKQMRETAEAFFPGRLVLSNTHQVAR